MFGKILFHLLGSNNDDVCKSTHDDFEELMELEEGGWVIVNLPETEVDHSEAVDPLENLLIEHPSMSVYQMRRRLSGAEEELEEEGFEEEEEPHCRPVAVRRHISWRMAAWGLPVPCNVQLLSARRASAEMERKKLSHGALKRQNLTKVRYYRRYGHFKQPCQRLCNY
ncbi:tumor protein p53-inducible nuclear protein 1 [Synchiropus splendidus]|uniref:tumor protein p53-inducible nuclear protein 1 n=1 Tax=Synchiropus splendidus TaxID=270530 RepID=UPI00237D3E59|nr:tumor protein p53-inducible nuclear protein 1 [Synchiropus splendidus]